MHETTKRARDPAAIQDLAHGGIVGPESTTIGVTVLMRVVDKMTKRRQSLGNKSPNARPTATHRDQYGRAQIGSVLPGPFISRLALMFAPDGHTLQYVDDARHDRTFPLVCWLSERFKFERPSNSRRIRVVGVVSCLPPDT